MPSAPVSSAPVPPTSAVPAAEAVPTAPVTGVPYPATGIPYPLTAPPYDPAPTPRRSPWGVVFGIVSAVLLVVSGTLGVLYYQQREEARRTSADQQAQITALQTEVDQLKDELDDVETQLQRTEDDLADAEECVEAVQAFIDLVTNVAASGGMNVAELEAEASRLMFEMVMSCDVSL